MSESTLEKLVRCPHCNKQVIVHLDLLDLRSSKGGGITKRTIPHQDHLILLDIDGNGDIRNETAIEVDTDASSDASIIKLGQNIQSLLDADIRDTTLIVLDNPDQYVSFFGNFVHSKISVDQLFEFSYNSKRIKLIIPGKFKFIITELTELTELINLDQPIHPDILIPMNIDAPILLEAIEHKKIMVDKQTLVAQPNKSPENTIQDLQTIVDLRTSVNQENKTQSKYSIIDNFLSVYLGEN